MLYQAEHNPFDRIHISIQKKKKKNSMQYPKCKQAAKSHHSFTTHQSGDHLVHECAITPPVHRGGVAAPTQNLRRWWMWMWMNEWMNEWWMDGWMDGVIDWLIENESVEMGRGNIEWMIEIEIVSGNGVKGNGWIVDDWTIGQENRKEKGKEEKEKESAWMGKWWRCCCYQH